MVGGVDGLVSYILRGRVFLQKIVASPVPLRPYRPRREASTAVRAYIVENVLDALFAKGAFESADHRIHGIGWQRLIAVFAGGS
jgi:hypothetical protein